MVAQTGLGLMQVFVVGDYVWDQSVNAGLAPTGLGYAADIGL